MNTGTVTKATLGRLPGYLDYLQKIPGRQGMTVSATGIAKALGLGKFRYAEDLGRASGQGKPKVGYNTVELTQSLKGIILGRTADTRLLLLNTCGKIGKSTVGLRWF